MKKRITKAIYSICAAAGFMTAVLFPSYPSYAQILSASVDTADSAVTVAAPPSASKFEDIDENAWYFPYVDMLVRNGIINGTSDVTYSPSGSFNAAECAAVITRYLGLEDHAQNRKAQLEEAGAEGAQNWYCGYVQTLCDAGIIKDGEYGVALSDGLVQLTSADEFSRPIKRYEFAVLITRSFDINTDIVKVQSFYPEICDNGNHLIVGGKYDASLEKYAPGINDFWYIPEDAVWDVLKAYYNGIFNGDEAGNFNPNVPLARSEMSKVVAVIVDPSMRKREEFRNLNEAFTLTEENFIQDGWNEKTLDRACGKNMLNEVAKGISAKKTSDGFEVSFTPVDYPDGYFVEARFYDKASGVYTEKCKACAADREAVSATLKKPSVLLVLRNSADAKVEGVLRVSVSDDGKMLYDDLFKPVL